MEVNYNEIRENVIAKMMEHASTMDRSESGCRLQ